jgi:hypothetical protein
MKKKRKKETGGMDFSGRWQMFTGIDQRCLLPAPDNISNSLYQTQLPAHPTRSGPLEVCLLLEITRFARIGTVCVREAG